MYKLLIVEDDRDIAQAIRAQAERWGLACECVQDFRRVMEAFAAFQPHIAADNMNIVMAMNLGADDFVAKPFDQSVLMAKLQALLRRSYDFAVQSPVLSARGAFLDTGENLLRYEGQEIPLSKNEYRILLCLLENKGRVVSREKLMERLWATDSFVDENTLSVNVNRLRKRLDAAGLRDLIVTRVGLGYLIE